LHPLLNILCRVASPQALRGTLCPLTIPQSFTLSYIGAYGLYTIITKSALLIAVILAVSVPDITEIFGMLICTLNGILVSSAVYVMKKHRTLGFIWAAVSVAAVFLEYAVILLAANLIVATLLLLTTDPYNFINSFTAGAQLRGSHKAQRMGIPFPLYDRP
jgi:hypothetical protein